MSRKSPPGMSERPAATRGAVTPPPSRPTVARAGDGPRSGALPPPTGCPSGCGSYHEESCILGGRDFWPRGLADYSGSAVWAMAGGSPRLQSLTDAAGELELQLEPRGQYPPRASRLLEPSQPGGQYPPPRYRGHLRRGDDAGTARPLRRAS